MDHPSALSGLSVNQGRQPVSYRGLNQILKGDTNPIYFEESLDTSPTDSNEDVHDMYTKFSLTMGDYIWEVKWTNPQALKELLRTVRISKSRVRRGNIEN